VNIAITVHLPRMKKANTGVVKIIVNQEMFPNHLEESTYSIVINVIMILQVR
jgi:hypothetical protein